MDMVRRGLNYVSVQVGWFACALGAARGVGWVGPVVVGVLLTVQLVLNPDRRRELTLIAIVGVLGTVVDSVKTATGFLGYREGYSGISWLCPLWITAMWLNFATTVNGALGWLKGRYALAAVLGAIAGPLNYLAGARMGAIDLNLDLGPTVVILALVWGMVIPLVFWIAERIELGDQSMGVQPAG